MINTNESKLQYNNVIKHNQHIKTTRQNQNKILIKDQNKIAPPFSEMELDSNNKLSPHGTERLWAVHSQQRYVPCDAVVNSLPSGQYVIGFNNNLGIYFEQKNINFDDLIILPDSASEEIIKQIEIFWTREQHFRKHGFLWKRGILLWGPPGSGKTTTLQIISSKIIEKGGLSVYVDDPSFAAVGLRQLRHIEPTRPILVMLEDLDAIIRDFEETSLLALLDGELQIDNVVFIATTNYPEKLDKRITNRPSRFDIIKKIEMPSAKARELFLLKKNPRLAANKSELKKWIDATAGFSIAHIKELIISVEVLEVDFQDSIKRLRDMKQIHLESDDGMDHRSVGFFNI